MKRLIIIIFAILALPLSLRAQNTIVGDKLPEVSVRKWLMDAQPEEAEYSCWLFYHSESRLCQQALENIKRHIAKYDKRLNLKIITKEEHKDAGVTLTKHLKEYVGVAFDDAGKTFRYFGVKYIPYCVISRKNRVVWCGNAAMLNDQTISKIITSK